MKAQLLFTVAGSLAYAANANGAKFKIVHINDFHSRVEGISATDSPCDNSSSAVCDGGWARLFAAAKAVVSKSTVPVIFVEDGDQFEGTLWSSLYKGQVPAMFINRLCANKEDGGAGFAACVGTLGNHEFDYKGDETYQYLESLENITMVSSNIVDNCQGARNINALTKTSHTVSLPNNGGDVTFVGYTTSETKSQSSPPSCVNFNDERASLKALLPTLNGASIVIAIGHSGYLVDQVVAQEVAGLDFIVGGHSHTYLWEGDESSNPLLSGSVVGDASKQFKTKIVGAYPTVVNTVPIVQAYFGGRYMGVIELEFDAQGVLTKTAPEMLLLGHSPNNATDPKYQFDLDQWVLGEINKLKVPLQVYKETVIGKSKGLLNGERAIIRTRETNLGGMICDAMVDHLNENTAFVEKYGTVDLAVMNAGGIRASIGSAQGPTNVTRFMVNSVLNFGNVIAAVNITGLQLWNLFESSTARWSTVAPQGEFLQVSKGVYVEFDPSQNATCGACVGCAKCTTANKEFRRVRTLRVNGENVPQDASVKYQLATNDFLTRGGDSYQILAETDIFYGTGPVLETIFGERITALTASAGEDGFAVAASCRIQNKALPNEACATVEETAAPTTAPPSAAPTPTPPKRLEGSIVAVIAIGSIILVSAVFFGAKSFKSANKQDNTSVAVNNL